MNNRLANFSQWLQEQSISTGFITSTANVFYLSDFYSDPHERLLGLFVFPYDEPILVCPNMEVPAARGAGWRYEIIGYSDTDHPWELIQKAIAKRSISIEQVAIEIEHLNVERYEKLQHLFSDAAFVSAENKLHQLRMIKDKNEIATLRQAAELADYGVEVGVHSIAEGKSELEILATIEYELKKKGINQMSFATMVLTGVKTAAPHGTPGLTKVKKGDLVLYDLGVVLDGYCSDITRTVAYKEINPKQQEIYHTVLDAQLAAVKACKPGVKIGEIDTIAREVISKAGYGDYFTHRIGHGLGIDVHEFPSMNGTNEMLLQQGMTFTIEPGIYVPEIGGVRIEDDLLITDSGVEVLTNYPKELQIVQERR